MSAATTISVHVNYDILIHVVEQFRNDYDMLFKCSLVNWEFNRTASHLLYSRVVLSAPFRSLLDLRDNGIPSVSHFCKLGVVFIDSIAAGI